MSADSRKFSIIGTSVPRVDGLAKVTGKARYTGDLFVPNMIEGKFLRSPYAHARILSINTREAEALPGVVTVLTSTDLTNPYMGRGKNKDQPIVATDRALYAGQPVAAVAALDSATAEEALSRIVVEYEPLPAVIDIQEAIAEGAPQIHAFAERNICFHCDLVKGDVERGFAEADEIFEDTFTTQRQAHACIETHGAICLVTPDGKLTLWSSTQVPGILRDALAETLGLPAHRIRVVAPDVGGGFGIKTVLYPEEVAVCALALELGRPPLEHAALRRLPGSLRAGQSAADDVNGLRHRSLHSRHNASHTPAKQRPEPLFQRYPEPSKRAAPLVHCNSSSACRAPSGVSSCLK